MQMYENKNPPLNSIFHPILKQQVHNVATDFSLTIVYLKTQIQFIVQCFKNSTFSFSLSPFFVIFLIIN